MDSVAITETNPCCYRGEPNTYYLAAGRCRKTRLVVWTDASGVEHHTVTADWWALVNRVLYAEGIVHRRWPVGTEFSTYEGT